MRAFIIAGLLIFGSSLIYPQGSGSVTTKTVTDAAALTTGSGPAVTSSKTEAPEWYRKARRPRAVSDNRRGSVFFTLLQIVFYLGIILIIIYLIYRYLASKKGVVAGPETSIRKLSLVPLFGNKYLQVIEVGEKVYLLGITDTHISLISEITEKEVIDNLRLTASKQDFETSPLSNFQSMMGDFLVRTGLKPPGAGIRESVDGIHLRKTRLREARRADEARKAELENRRDGNE